MVRLIIVSIQFFPLKSEQSESRNAKFPPLKSLLVGGGGGLFDYSVKPGPELSRSRLGLVWLLTRTAKAMFG